MFKKVWRQFLLLSMLLLMLTHIANIVIASTGSDYREGQESGQLEVIQEQPYQLVCVSGSGTTYQFKVRYQGLDVNGIRFILTILRFDDALVVRQENREIDLDGSFNLDFLDLYLPDESITTQSRVEIYISDVYISDIADQHYQYTANHALVFHLENSNSLTFKQVEGSIVSSSVTPQIESSYRESEQVKSLHDDTVLKRVTKNEDVLVKMVGGGLALSISLGLVLVVYRNVKKARARQEVEKFIQNFVAKREGQ